MLLFRDGKIDNMNKFALLITLVLLLIALTPASTQVKDFIMHKVDTDTPETDSVWDQTEIEINNEDLSPTPSLNPTQAPQVNTKETKEEIIDKKDGNVRYQGSVKSSKTETSSKVSENGTTKVTNSNTLNSSTNIKVNSETGGNQGQNVNEGDSKVSIKVRTNDDGTKVEIP